MKIAPRQGEFKNKKYYSKFKVRKLHCTNYAADGALSLSPAPPAPLVLIIFLASRRLAGTRKNCVELKDDVKNLLK
ncbi:unnamed protein product, partial [Brenthis ino]